MWVLVKGIDEPDVVGPFATQTQATRYADQHADCLGCDVVKVLVPRETSYDYRLMLQGLSMRDDC